MNLKTFAGAIIFTTASLFTPNIAFSQPSTTGSYQSGFWQPTATVDNTKNITVILSNQSGFNLNYDSVYGPVFGAVLPAGGSATMVLPAIDSADEIANISIYSPDGYWLVFDYSTDENNNNNAVTVRVRLSAGLSGQGDETGTDAEFDSAVYIDEQGRVYSF